MRKSPRKPKKPQMYEEYDMQPAVSKGKPARDVVGSPSRITGSTRTRTSARRAAAASAGQKRPAPSKTTPKKARGRVSKARGKVTAKGKKAKSEFAKLVSLASSTNEATQHVPGLLVHPDALKQGGFLSPPRKRQRTGFTEYGSPVVSPSPRVDIEGDVVIHPVVELPHSLIPPQERRPNSNMILAHAQRVHNSPKAMRWAKCEWFYSRTDEIFLKHNDFVECLIANGHDPEKKRTMTAWRKVRRDIGAPRRLSPAFLQQERKKLHNFRKNVTHHHLGLDPALDGLFPVLLTPTTQVLAFTSEQQPRIGVVVQSLADRYEVRFAPRDEKDKVLVWLPEARVMEADDEPCLRISSETMVTPERAKEKEEAAPDEDPLATLALAAVVSPKHNGDVRTLVSVMDLLKRKEQLLYSLNALNEKAERTLKNRETYTQEFKQEYARLVLSLEDTSTELKPVLKQLRSSQLPGQNFSRERARG